MRADRVVALVLLLRRHGRLSASTLARELEVSTRTVMRDVEALSAAGVPVYAERGRFGGIALLPGFRTELTGLTHDEALALLVAGSRRGGRAFGLGSALASAMLKVVDALPDDQRAVATDAIGRLLVDPETDLLERRAVVDDEVPAATTAAVRGAVLGGRRLRIRYAAADRDARWRTVDPVGLVAVRGRTYLLALRDGEERTYRLSRMEAVEELPEPARRPDRVDLAPAWRERGARFRNGDDRVGVTVRLDPRRRDELVATALDVRSEIAADDGLRLDVVFQDARHARWALWQLGADADVLDPAWLRTALHERATAMATRYAAGPGLT